jgi:Flp pilus assembly protein TadD
MNAIWKVPVKLPKAFISLAQPFALACFLFQMAVTCQAQAPAHTNPETTASKSLPENFEKQISSLAREQKIEEADQLIARQETITPDDPDLAVAKANLNLLRPEAQPHIVLNQFPAGTNRPPANVEKAFQILDAETSEPKGYLGQEVPEQRPAAVKQSLEILRTAVGKHPERLDIRLGISQLHALNGDYDNVLKNLEETTKYAASRDYKGFALARGKSAPDAASIVDVNLHRYYIEYTQETAQLDDKLAFRFAETTTRYFPKDVRAWNDLCAEYAQRGDNPKAIESLLKAYELDKKDPIVMMNLAHLYDVTKKPDQAIIYYQKVLDLKDPEYTQDATDAIEELKKKQDQNQK